MTWVFANNTHDTFPADNPAGITKFLNRGSDFHGKNGVVNAQMGLRVGVAVRVDGERKPIFPLRNASIRLVLTSGGRDSYHTRQVAQEENANSHLDFL